MIEKRRIWKSLNCPRGHSHQAYSDYKDGKREFRKYFRMKQHEWETQEYDNIEQSAEVDQQKFWQYVKKRRTKGPTKFYDMVFDGKTCHTDTDIRNGWSEYFANLYKPLDQEQFNDNHRQQIEYELKQRLKEEIGFHPHLDQDISESEVEEAITDLPLGKAGGYDGLTYEHVIYGGQEIIKHLSHLFCLILHLTKVPSAMKRGLEV